MEQVDLIAPALNLTLFGMGFVFLFLTVLVFVTQFMSMIISKLQKQASEENHNDNPSSMENEIDEEAKFVIEQAIKMHRGA